MMIPAEAVTVKLAEDALAAMPAILDAARAMTDHLADDVVRVIEAEARGDLAEAEAIARPWIAAIDKSLRRSQTWAAECQEFGCHDAGTGQP